ncbi:MAG TPA: ribonuclease P protein component [Oribacterium sp.]|nr:ribonuclease P protein component [Oribacterium sp.]
MKRFPSVKKNSEFQRAYQTGRSFASSALVMYVCKNEAKHNRLGVSCSKKIGNSVVRHTFARKMREIFRLNDFRVKQGFDIIVVIRGGANDCTYQQIEAQYLNLLNRHHIILKDAEAAQPIPSKVSK